MRWKAAKERLLRILEIEPSVKEIMLSGDALEEKRAKLNARLSHILESVIEKDPEISPLEWIVVKDAAMALRALTATRNEKQAGFGMLNYLNQIINEEDAPEGVAIPSPGFLEEVEHLIRGIAGKSNLYEGGYPEHSKRKGREAALLRSEELSGIAAEAQKLMSRYVSGLDTGVIRKRSLNKARIMKYFKATDYEWDDWKWHVRNIIRDAETLRKLVRLTEEEYEGVKLANENGVPFGITPYYLSLMDYKPGLGRDQAVRAQVLPSKHYVTTLRDMKGCGESSMDFMLEKDTSPIEAVTRRYPMIVILKPLLTCPQICVYCQRNWEITDVYDPDAEVAEDKMKEAIAWIAQTPEIREVLITGGDPLLLSDRKVENLLYRLAKIDHIDRVRIGTRTPVTMPQRITDKLVRAINRFHQPGFREVCVVTHFEHPYEITPQSMGAVQKFRSYGMEVLNQLVFTLHNSRRFEASALRSMLRLIGVAPYYTFNTKGKEETDDYRAPIARLLQEQKEEARLMPGTVRTDEVVFNVPGLGKNYLRARQHHDIIAILPDGRRVYEFHPWEKQLSLVDTYTHADVSIYDYLRRLEKNGEDVSKYRTIWYYY